MPIKIKNETYLTRKEAAAYIGYSPGTLEVWASIKKDFLEYIMRGGRAYYSLTILDEFLERSLVS